MYSKEIQTLLNSKSVSQGDRIRVNGLEGYLLPSPDSASEEVLVVKLDNGYNIGVKPETLEKLSGRKEFGQIPEAKIARHEGLADVSLIATGGTIGTHLDYASGGVFMCRTPEQVLAVAPELEGVVNFKSLLSPFTVASEDMNYSHWQKLAELTAKELNSGAKGVILTHGTDCLGFTASALSFMLPKLGKPVALVGAQRSPDRGSFDGAFNLVCAANYAKSDFGEVAIVMHASSSDDFCHALRGTKVRKMHTSRRDAFKAINEKPLARVWPDGKIEKTNSEALHRTEGKVKADTSFEPKIAVLKAYPGSLPEIIDFLLEKKTRGIIIEGTALGHVPTGESGTNVGKFDAKKSWIPFIKKAVDKGVFVGIASQTIYGRTNPFVYRNLRLAGGAGAIFLEDMLAETAYIKLGWVLGHTKKAYEAREMMLTNYCGEINYRIKHDEFV